jgi:hypothetical protein
MTRDEVMSEKLDTQKELLSYEDLYGRPVSFRLEILVPICMLCNGCLLKDKKQEKDLMRPIYDHYRKVKRILGKKSVKKLFTMNH